MNFLEKCFKLKENHTTVKKEVMAGVTTFMTMAYILVVNPNILSQTGMDYNALLSVTCISAALGTLFMALFANYPFALAPGMGLNVYFAYTVVLQYGYKWQTALAAVFVEGLIFLLLSAVNVREAIFNAIPGNMKKAVSVGIGMYIAFIGLQNAGVIVNNAATCVALGNVKTVPVALALIGTIITLALVIRRVMGALFFGILITWGMGVVCQMAGAYQVDEIGGVYSLIPTGIVSLPSSIMPITGHLSFEGLALFDFIVILFAFLFVDLFDTLGTLIGVSEKAGFLDKNGKLPRIKGALFADAAATTLGACMGTSTVTTFVESASGVADGGRTGLTAFTTAMLFLGALLFSPVLTVIPAFATTPALITVGLFMVENVTQIDFKDYTEGFPAFVTILMMVAAYSISEGLVFGVISYVLLKLLSGRRRELHPVIVIIAVLFLLKMLAS